MKLFDRIVVAVISVFLVGIIINWFTDIVDPGVVTDAVTSLGRALGSLESTDKKDQLLSVLLVCLAFLVTVAVVWLFVHWRYAITAVQAASLPMAKETEEEIVATLESQMQKVQDLETSLGLVLDLSDRLRILLHKDIGKTDTEFRDLCNLIVEHLSDTTYKGRVPGKVSFIQFDRFTFFVPMRGVAAQEFRERMMNLPIMRDALRNGTTEYLHDIQGQKQQYRVTDGEWTLSCSSIMVVPIQPRNGVQGVFGIYSDDPSFFKDMQDPDIPEYFRSVLEVSAAIRETALTHSDHQERG